MQIKKCGPNTLPYISTNSTLLENITKVLKTLSPEIAKWFRTFMRHRMLAIKNLNFTKFGSYV